MSIDIKHGKELLLAARQEEVLEREELISEPPGTRLMPGKGKRSVWASWINRNAPALLDEADKAQIYKRALTDLLKMAERIRGGDSKLDPEEWYAERDYVRVLLADEKP